ncbi:unnamed protein product [Symbiodinium natans]|uniref:Uncharacterized protein n=1 Tax=Symbiodinium natans TaxID=878477 RepID=A0A812PWW1_9DINO|nr:unnamed protein product [Symbiodinium natans]
MLCPLSISRAYFFSVGLVVLVFPLVCCFPGPAGALVYWSSGLLVPRLPLLLVLWSHGLLVPWSAGHVCLHWAAAEFALHSDQTRPLLEPGLDQWLPLWKHWKPYLAEIRKGVAADVRTLVEEMQPEVDAWFQNLEPHVKLAYGSKTGTCTVKVPVIAKIAKMFGWQDDSLFQEMSSGFPLLGHINPGLGWRLRHDERYSDPVDLETFQADNFQYVQKKLKQARVDPFWQTMAEEIAADVKAGRMEGPFAVPSSWSKETVALPDYTHTAELLPAPSCHEHTCFAFSVQQVGSDGRRKVRRAEDWRRSGGNKTVNVPDTPAYHSIEAFIAVIRALRHLGEEGAIATWGLDHESAYRQLPVLRPADTYVVLQTPRGPTLWRHRVLMFGSVASVWGYCRVADWMAWASRCLLLTPALHFVDDFGAPETCPEADTSFQYVQIRGCNPKRDLERGRGPTHPRIMLFAGTTFNPII